MWFGCQSGKSKEVGAKQLKSKTFCSGREAFSVMHNREYPICLFRLQTQLADIRFISGLFPHMTEVWMPSDNNNFHTLLFLLTGSCYRSDLCHLRGKTGIESLQRCCVIPSCPCWIVLEPHPYVSSAVSCQQGIKTSSTGWNQMASVPLQSSSPLHSSIPTDLEHIWPQRSILTTCDSASVCIHEGQVHDLVCRDAITTQKMLRLHSLHATRSCAPFALQGEQLIVDKIFIQSVHPRVVFFITPKVFSSKNYEDVKQGVSPGSGFCASSWSWEGVKRIERWKSREWRWRSLHVNLLAPSSSTLEYRHAAPPPITPAVLLLSHLRSDSSCFQLWRRREEMFIHMPEPLHWCTNLEPKPTTTSEKSS